MSDALAALRRLKGELPFYAQHCLRIIDKNSKLVPFTFNRAQTYIHDRLEAQKRACGFVRAVIVKGRQQGCSTYISGRYFHLCHFEGYQSAFILTHHSEATDNLFGMTARYYQNLPEPIREKLKTDNSREMVLANGSNYTVGTAGNAEVGRSKTITLCHCSETAYWENPAKIVAGLLQAIPESRGTELIFESTANGPGDFFHALALKAASNVDITHPSGLANPCEFQLIFVPWYWQPEYARYDPSFVKTEEEETLQRLHGISDLHLCWRRAKIEVMSLGGADGLVTFKREYPNTIEDAFSSSARGFFDPNVAAESVARYVNTQAIGAKVMGVDPAREGGNKTVLCIRQGKKVLRFIRFDKMNEMALAGIVARVIEEEQLDAVFIDVGYGYGTIDRLRELGYRRVVKEVSFGSSAVFNKDAWRNKRSEMHGDARDWLEQGGAIPDDNSFVLQLLAIPAEKESSTGAKYLVPKDEIKLKLGGESPDDVDSFVLTFAAPVRSNDEKRGIAKKTMPSAVKKRSALDERLGVK